MKLRLFLYTAYPILILLYLLPISLFYIKSNNSIVVAFLGLIPIVLGHPDPVMLFKEVFKNIGVGYKINSIDEQYSDYKKTVEEILKEHNLNYDVKIIDNEIINMYAGKSTIYITKGFVKFFPLNTGQDRIKILPLLGHEITHQKRMKAYIKEIFTYITAFVILFVLINIFGILLFGEAFNIFFYYTLFLSFYLLILYLLRRNELEADKGGFELAKDNTWLIEFLKNMDGRKEKSYNLLDKFDELFRYHPNPVNRIKKLEKTKVMV